MKLKSFSQTLGLALLTVISLRADESAQIYLSAAEVQEIYDNPTRSYVYVGKDVTNLADIIAEINKLEDEENSPTRALEDHINKGFVIGNYDGVAQALEHAEAVLNRVEPDRTSELSQALNAIIEQVDAEQLNINAAILEAANVAAPETRACGSCNSHCLRELVIKEKVDFLNKIKFRDDVTFYDDVRFRDDVRIDGSLSVSDQVLGCDLTVGCNISINDTVSTAIGNIVQGGTRLAHNFGTNNLFVGRNAGNYTLTGTDNAAFGFNALTLDSTGSFNTALGVSTLAANTTGIQNVAVGAGALQNNVTGQTNTATGTNALFTNAAGNNNVAVGASALFANTTGVDNTAIGTTALAAVTTGSTNIAIGSGAGATLATGNNNIYIGANAASAAESNVTRIGGIRGATTAVADAITVLIDSTGQLGTINSSKSYKHNIQSMNDVSANIYNLNPVTFVYNSDASETTQYGLIAEEVADVFPGIVVRNANGQPETVQYHVLPVLLLNEFQKLAARVAVLEARA